MNNKTENYIAPKRTQVEAKVDNVDNKDKSFAASWYVVMQSSDLPEKPIAIELFGQPLVAWRDQNGHPIIMERYCSHMGGNLVIGKVVEGCIQCPFHHWRFDSSGECVSIPDVEHIPPKARQMAYVTAERYGYIWVWYGSQTPLFSLPNLPFAEAQSHDYMPFRFQSSVATTVRRVVESPYDYSHIVTAHNQKISGPIQCTLLDNQHLASQNELPNNKEPWFGALIEFPSDNSYAGRLGLVAKALGLYAKSFSLQVDSWPSGHSITSSMDGVEIFKILNAPTPLTKEKAVVHVLLMVKKTGSVWRDIIYYFLFIWQIKIVTTEDNQIFDNTKLGGGGAYVKNDFGVLKFREFYQYWVNKVDL
jgi:aminopyrrolnitrin oxygenase